jgi:hypothetical protein
MVRGDPATQPDCFRGLLAAYPASATDDVVVERASMGFGKDTNGTEIVALLHIGRLVIGLHRAAPECAFAPGDLVVMALYQ